MNNLNALGPSGGDNRVHATSKYIASTCSAATPVIIPHITQQECGRRSVEWASQVDLFPVPASFPKLDTGAET